MTDNNASKKKQSKCKGVAPVPDEAFASRQLSLFQGFLANTNVEADNCETNWPTNLKLSTNM